MANSFLAENFRPHAGNTTPRGHFDLRCANTGLIIRDVMLHEAANGNPWISPQGIPQLDGATLRVVGGKPDYVQTVTWASHEARKRFTADILAQLEAFAPRGGR